MARYGVPNDPRSPIAPALAIATRRQHPGEHAHHIRHWANGGRTILANLISLCGRHHHLAFANARTTATYGHN
jgi:hypothetical protein